MGDRAWATRINGHLDDVSRIVEEADGTLVKSLGDGTMSTFRSTRAALTAARAIQALALADDAHRGSDRRQGRFFGTVVNKAARINAVADPDETRLTDATNTMLGRTEDFKVDDPQDVVLKGFDGTHRLYRLKA